MPVTTGRTVIRYRLVGRSYAYDIPNHMLPPDHLEKIESLKKGLGKKNKADIEFEPGAGISELIVTPRPIDQRGVVRQISLLLRRVRQIIEVELGLGEVDIIPTTVH